MNLLRRLAGWLRPKLPYLNIALVIGCYLSNQYAVQGFCQPVPWVWWVLMPGLLAFLAWPWLSSAPQPVRQAAWLLQGLFLPVCLYCVLFIALDPQLYLLGLVLFFLGFPLLLWTPAFFTIQLLRRQAAIPYARQLFLAGALGLLPFYLVAQVQAIQFWQVMALVQRRNIYQLTDLARIWPHTYMGERMLGMTWRYHTSPEFIYDGWRPPLHDPVANLVGITTGLFYPHTPFPSLSTEQQAELYHLAFTDRPTKPDCVCASLTDAEGFLDWHPEWNDPDGATERTGRAGLFGDEVPPEKLAEAERVRKEVREFEATLTADSSRAASRPANRP